MTMDYDANPQSGALTQMGGRLAATGTRDELIALVKDSARSLCKADGITFILRDGDMCRYVEEDAIGPLWKGQSFPMTACISGWSMLNAQTAVIEDVFADPRIPHDAYRPTFVKSLVMTPVGEGEIAAMGAYWREHRSFSATDLATIKTYCALVGHALSQTLARA